jgi:hypothetical protein
MNCTMMDGSTGMMLTMGSTYLLFVIVLILMAASLVKYLFGAGPSNKNVENSDA